MDYRRKVGRVARQVPEDYCPAITDPLKLMYSIPHKNTIFLVPLYLNIAFCCVLTLILIIIFK
jgi:hypothetical protein